MIRRWRLWRLGRLEARMELLAIRVRASLAAELDNKTEVETWRKDIHRLQYRAYVLRYKLFGAVPPAQLVAVAGGKAEAGETA